MIANQNASAVPSVSTAAISALHQGNKIEAIKIVRRERNIGLKEAKDVIEEYLRDHPSLQSSLAAAQAETKRKVVLWLLALAVVVLLVYQFLVEG